MDFDNFPDMVKKKLRNFSVETQQDRVRLLRKALEMSQADICRMTGISSQAWNNTEKRGIRMGVDNAMLLCRTGATLDFIYFGRRELLPANILAGLIKAEKEEQQGQGDLGAMKSTKRARA